MEDPDFSFWACTQAITDGPNDDPSSRENPTKVDDFGYIVLNDKANNECYILKEGENTIGRHPLNNIYIEHPSVSMSHAVIQCDSDGVVLLDKGSLNKTRLNKKILKKNVAYFLDENALLIFGEVQANYYVDTVPSDSTCIKASNEAHVQNTTEIDGVSKLSNTIITTNSLYAGETSNTISGTDVSSVTENSSVNKTETTVLNCIAESDLAKSKLDGVRSDVNSPSPSDEFLLDAISQIESREVKVNSPEFLLSDENTCSPVVDLSESISIAHMSRIDNDILSVSDIQRLCSEIMPEDVREDTPSPVMDLGPLIDYDGGLFVQETDNHNTPKTNDSSPEEDLTQSISIEHVLKIDNNTPLVPDTQGLCTEVVSEATREDTPSPVMDLGPLIDYDGGLSVQETNNHNTPKTNDSSPEEDLTQSISKENVLSVTQGLCTEVVSEATREDTPSPVMDLGPLIDFDDRLSVHETENHGILSSNQSADVLNSNMLDECTQQPVMDIEDAMSLTSKSKSVNYNNQIEDKISSDLDTFKNVRSDNVTKKNELNNGDNSTSLTKKPSADEKEHMTEHNQNMFNEDDDIFISVDRKIESFGTQNKNILQTNGTDNVSDLNNTKSNNNSLNKSEFSKVSNDLCENPSTSKYSHSKTETVFSETSASKQNDNTFEADDDDIFNDFIKKEFDSQSHTSTRKINKDFSKCPKQNLSLSLKKQETQSLSDIPPQGRKTSLGTSNTGSTSKSNDLNQVFELADDDFFNCPTQKISISKKINEMKKLSQSIHEQETQPIEYLATQPRKVYPSTSVPCSTSKNEDFEMNDDDFFNCPTQKISISKKLNETKKASVSIHEQETQPMPDLPNELKKVHPSTSITDSSNKNKDLNFGLDDDDFFNCPTQKISISKKLNEAKKTFLCIHEQETQPIPDLPIQPKKACTCMRNATSTSKSKDLNLEIDDEDFFNCPTQKVSVSKKMNETIKTSVCIHEQETQPLPKLSAQPRKVYPSTSIPCSTSKNEDIKMNDDDFFNCPTQKISVPKKMKKQSLSIHEQETQPIPDLPTQLKKVCSSTFIPGPTNKNEDLNFEMDNDDFFNCPTQKISISKKLHEMKKGSQSIHEQETQPLPGISPQHSKTYIGVSSSDPNNKNKNVNRVPEKDDEDFFNCPTQKLSISKDIKKMKKESQSIHEQETQPPPCFPLQTKEANSSLSFTEPTNKTKDLKFEMDDDDFFNCPTQKISISKKMNELKKLSLTIHEQETQPIDDLPTQSRKTDLVMSNITSSSKSKDLNSEIDDEDFFNCPTQKLSFSNKLNERKKTSLSIHEQETQPIPDLPTQPRKTDVVMSNITFSSKSKDLNFGLDDDDFFNCPTQKISISKKLNEAKKTSLSIHEQETQPIPDLPTQPRKTDVVMSNITSSSKSKDLNSEIDDEDFFNCPTQKLSFSNKLNERKKTSLSIHEQETQPIPDLPTQPRKTDVVMSNITSSSKSKDLNSEIADEDFFNCPTQKLSFSNKLNERKRTSPSIHEQETQPIPDLPSQPRKSYIGMPNTSSTIQSKDLNLEIDEDFFNRPTQPLPDFSPSSYRRQKHSNNRAINSHNDSSPAPEIDEEFFNRPTQPLLDNLQQPSTTNTVFDSRASIVNINSSRVSLDDKNGLNPNTQKPLPYGISSTGKHKRNVFNKNEAETQKLSPVDISTVSTVKMNAPGKIKQNKENIDTTQKVSSKTKLKTNKGETEGQSIGSDGLPYGTKPNIIPGKAKRFCPNGMTEERELSNQNQSVVSDPTDKHMVRKSSRIHAMSKSKPSVQLPAVRNQNIKKSNSNNKPIIYVRKDLHDSTSNQNAGENNTNTSTYNNIVQPSCSKITPDDDSDLILLASIKKEILEDESVQHQFEDSYSLRSKDGLKQKNETILSTSSGPSTATNQSSDQYQNLSPIQSSANINVVQESSKTSSEGDSDLILLASIKKELLGDDSLRQKDHSKQKNETVLSISNGPSTSTNPSTSQHQNSTSIQSNVDLADRQPSTSNDNSSQWKSFWNQKKMACQKKGKSLNQKNAASTNDVVKKEQYQTRANTMRDNSVEFNRKRKQDNVNIEEGNKRMCRDNTDDRLTPPVQGTSDIVVTFSYLKSRNLVKMKQFVETTGGHVTDEITECTVLVTDKVRCSMKVLSAIAKGCPIVDSNWVKHSYIVKMFQDVDDFIILDKDAERKHKFKLKESLARAKAKGLLDGYTVMVTPSVKPSPKDMKVIITCAGGNYVMNWPKKRQPHELIVTCEHDRHRWKPLWDNNKAKIIDNDAFIMSIMRQKLSV